MTDTYAFLTTDTRYSAPTMNMVAARSEAHARELALDRLRESQFHQSVEVGFEDLVLFKVTRADL